MAKCGEESRVVIRDLGTHGEGIGSHNGYTLFVDGALPGEVVTAQIVEQKKRYGRATLLAIEQSSQHRVDPPCPLFGSCGGCQLMHLAYPEQLVVKRQRVVDALQRIGKFDAVEVLSCEPSPLSLGYRNKIQLPVEERSEGLIFGLYARGSHQLQKIDGCAIHCSLGEEVFAHASTCIKKSGITAYDTASGTGDLRHLLIKSAQHTGQALVILVTNGEPTDLHRTIAEQIMASCPAVQGVVHNSNRERNNIILGKVYTLLAGQGSIRETLLHLTFTVSPASFFQVNPLQAERLYAKALEYAALKGTETVLDAYCGVGTFSLIFATQAKYVIGVECVPEAIRDAEQNALLNGFHNTSFTCANAEAHINTLCDIDLVLLNPPRKGCDPDFLAGIGRLLPKKVLYISCDPATLARDLALLARFGYRIDLVHPFDMFPQTAHVECLAVVTLDR